MQTRANGSARAYGFGRSSSGAVELWAAPMSGVSYPSGTGVDYNRSRGARFSVYQENPSAFPQNVIWSFGTIKWDNTGGIAGNITRFSASDATKYPTRSTGGYAWAQDSVTAGSKVSIGDLKIGPSTTAYQCYVYARGYFSYSSGYGSLMFWTYIQDGASSASIAVCASVGDLANMTPIMTTTLSNGAMAITSDHSMNVFGGKPTSQTSMEYFRVKFTVTRGLTAQNKINFASGTTSDLGGSGLACSYSQSDTTIYLVCGMIRSSRKGVSVIKYNTSNDTITWAREITSATYDLDSFALWSTPADATVSLICQANYACVDENGNVYIATCVKYAAGNYRPIIFKYDSSGNLLSQWEYNRFASGSASDKEWAVGSLVYNKQTASLWMLCINPTDNFAYIVKVSATDGSYSSELQMNEYSSSVTPGGYPGGNIDVNTTGQYIVYSGNYQPSSATYPAQTFQLLKTDGSNVGTRNYNAIATNFGNWTSSYNLPASGNYWNVNTSSTSGTSTSQTYTVSAGTYYSTGNGTTGSTSVNNQGVYA